MIHRRIIDLAAAILACAIAATAFAADDQVIFVGPSGANGASGASADEPVADLQAAVDKGLAGVEPKRKIVVRVLPGAFRGQTLKITTDPARYGRIEIVRADAKSRPVFDGDGSTAPWLSVAAGDAGGGSITVEGLEIRSYSTAINLAGSRDMPDRSVTDVTIRNNVFRNIGQQSERQKNPSTAAVRLVNADRIEIINNQFLDIRNRERCGLLHALYIAHGSTGNLIKGNTFQNACGDAVRFRDGSGGNRVEGNTFVDAWANAAVSDWYCESDTRDDCSKKYKECPSFGNSVVANKVVARSAKSPEATKVYGNDAVPGCEVPARTRQRAGTPQRFSAD